MLEWLVVIGLVVIAVKVADMEHKSPLICGAVMFGLCMGSAYAFPGLPFVRMLIAGAAAVGVWVAAAIVRKGQ